MGETENPLHLWMNGQRSDYYCRLPDKHVVAHFNEPDHTFDKVSVMVVEQMGMAGASRRSIGRAIGFVVYDHCPRMVSISITYGPQAASVVQLGIKKIF